MPGKSSEAKDDKRDSSFGQKSNLGWPNITRTNDDWQDSFVSETDGADPLGELAQHALRHTPHDAVTHQVAGDGP